MWLSAWILWLYVRTYTCGRKSLTLFLQTILYISSHRVNTAVPGCDAKTWNPLRPACILLTIFCFKILNSSRLPIIFEFWVYAFNPTEFRKGKSHCYALRPHYQQCFWMKTKLLHPINKALCWCFCCFSSLIHHSAGLMRSWKSTWHRCSHM